MSGERIGIVYSRSFHFRRTLRRLREEHPDATLVAYVPRNYPERLIADARVDVRKRTAAGIGGNLAFARALRRERLDSLVILFNSPRLRLLLWLSGAQRGVWHSAAGERHELTRAPWGYLLRQAWRQTAGWLRFGCLWLAVRMRPVRRP